MSMSEAQNDELQVLESMFAEDEIVKRSNTSFSFKVTPEDYDSLPDADKKILWLDIEWPTEYPDVVPLISLENSDILSKNGKAKLTAELQTQAEGFLGMAMTHSLVEHLRQNWNDLVTIDALKDQGNLWENIGKSTVPHKEPAPKEPKPATAETGEGPELSKAAKRRLAARTDFKTGEKPRGWNWVDVIAHLSKQASV